MRPPKALKFKCNLKNYRQLLAFSAIPAWPERKNYNLKRNYGHQKYNLNLQKVLKFKWDSIYIQPQINPILIAKEHSKGPPPSSTNKQTYKNDPLSLKKLRIIIINKAFLHVKKIRLSWIMIFI